MKNIVSEMKTILDAINSRLDEAEESISDLKDKVVENNQSSKKKKVLKNEDSLRDFWDNIKCNNSCIIGAPAGVEREQEIENLLK